MASVIVLLSIILIGKCYFIRGGAVDWLFCVRLWFWCFIGYATAYSWYISQLPAYISLHNRQYF